MAKKQGEDAFAIAAEALRLVGRFKTPPTPEIYEVWFRFVEGKIQEIHEQLKFAVDEVNEVSVKQLHDLYQQFCTHVDSVPSSVSENLVGELNNFQHLVDDQKSAGDKFEMSIEEAAGLLGAASVTDANLERCVGLLIEGNKTMQVSLHDMNLRLEEAKDQVEKLQQDLVESQRGLMTDPLTGVGNRRFFDTMIRKAIEDRDDSNEAVFLVLLDMDGLKSINDNFGHEAGDQVIRFVAEQVSQTYPELSLARLGGDEFAGCVRDTDRLEVELVMDKLRQRFNDQHLTIGNDDQDLGKLSFSAGVTKLKPKETAEEWYIRTDQLMYQAKKLGGNRVVIDKSSN